MTYLAFNEAYLSTGGPSPGDRDLASDAIWLASLIARELSDEPEALGLLALLTLHHAREPARFRDGRLVLLADQDRGLWDRRAIGEAEAALEGAAARRRPGRFELQAAIAACHADAPTWADTDWRQILLLYNALVDRYDPSPVTRLNRAVALSYAAGPEVALTEVEGLAARLDGYHLLHATRATLLRRAGRAREAQVADQRALALTRNGAERSLLEERLARS